MNKNNIEYVMSALENKNRLNKKCDLLVDLKEDVLYHLQHLSDNKFPIIKEKLDIHSNLEDVLSVFSVNGLLDLQPHICKYKPDEFLINFNTKLIKIEEAFFLKQRTADLTWSKDLLQIEDDLNYKKYVSETYYLVTILSSLIKIIKNDCNLSLKYLLTECDDFYSFLGLNKENLSNILLSVKSFKCIDLDYKRLSLDYDIAVLDCYNIRDEDELCEFFISFYYKNRKYEIILDLSYIVDNIAIIRELNPYFIINTMQVTANFFSFYNNYVNKIISEE